jgi:hypothetical protein
MSKAETLIEAIQDFFGDTSHTREETIAGLERAQQHIDLLLETLVDDDSAD